MRNKTKIVHLKAYYSFKNPNSKLPRKTIFENRLEDFSERTLNKEFS